MTKEEFDARQQPGGWTSASPLPTPSELAEFCATLASGELGPMRSFHEALDHAR